VHCILRGRLTNQGGQTKGLTNHTTEREGRGITAAQSGIRAALSAEKCFEMSLSAVDQNVGSKLCDILHG